MAFPNQQIAAISLTYDDGSHEHLDHAIPDLEQHGLRGTFYIPTGKCPTWPARIDEWRAAATRGHELGNHTVYHPCSERHNWIPKGKGLESHTLESIEAEMTEASRQLQLAANGAIQTFAYPCGEDFVTPQRVSFRHVVGRIFLASRGGGGADAVNDPATVDLHHTVSWGIPPEPDAQELIDYVDRTIARRGWGVLMFHGVGGGHRLNVSQETHQRVVAHIASLEQSLWCDTFANVAAYIQQRRRA